MTDRYDRRNAPLPRLDPVTRKPWKPGRDRIAQIFRDGQAEPLEIVCHKAHVDRHGRLICVDKEGRWVATFDRAAWMFWQFADVRRSKR